MNTDKIYAEKLASEYAPKDTSRIVALRKLDAKAKNGATVTAFTLGIVSSLVFGTGMCYTMGEIGSGTPTAMLIGIVLGVVGIIGMSVNYPIYKKLIARGKAKYGSDIIRLAREIAEGK